MELLGVIYQASIQTNQFMQHGFLFCRMLTA